MGRPKKRLTSGCAAAAAGGKKLMQDEVQSSQLQSSILLQSLLLREKRVYGFPLTLPAATDGMIGWRERNREAAWLCTAARRLGLGLDSTTMAVAIFDKVLTGTKVPNKYVNCVAVASLSIAKKLCEDHEEDAPVFLGRLRLEYSSQELKRMELLILQTLSWDASLPNTYRFIECLLQKIGAPFLLSSIKCHLETILCDSNLIANFRPSVLALSIVSLLIEATNRHWHHPVNALARMCKLPMCEITRCRTRIASLWSRHVLPMPSTFHLLASSSSSSNNQSTYPQIDGEESDEEMDFPKSRRQAVMSPSTPSPTSPSPRALQPTPC
ncbi:unnamed protein product [Caenorhabditis angaria]|uniref:Cyclin-like domain-containing protein n=1 Tax=Caenorhabditis angaria TaxID=860376 RepID=A0A9P1IIG5_9PELO|nr:unnamed protein product [Caenorhabditis angaria]